MGAGRRVHLGGEPPEQGPLRRAPLHQVEPGPAKPRRRQELDRLLAPLSPRASWRARRAPWRRAASPPPPRAAVRGRRPRPRPPSPPARRPPWAPSPATALPRAASRAARVAPRGRPRRDPTSLPRARRGRGQPPDEGPGPRGRAPREPPRAPSPTAEGAARARRTQRPLALRGALRHEEGGGEEGQGSAGRAARRRGASGKRDRTHATIRSAPRHLRTSIHATARLQRTRTWPRSAPDLRGRPRGTAPDDGLPRRGRRGWSPPGGLDDRARPRPSAAGLGEPGGHGRTR